MNTAARTVRSRLFLGVIGILTGVCLSGCASSSRSPQRTYLEDLLERSGWSMVRYSMPITPGYVIDEHGEADPDIVFPVQDVIRDTLRHVSTTAPEVFTSEREQFSKRAVGRFLGINISGSASRADSISAVLLEPVVTSIMYGDICEWCLAHKEDPSYKAKQVCGSSPSTIVLKCLSARTSHKFYDKSGSVLSVTAQDLFKWFPTIEVESFQVDENSHTIVSKMPITIAYKAEHLTCERKVAITSPEDFHSIGDKDGVEVQGWVDTSFHHVYVLVRYPATNEWFSEGPVPIFSNHKWSLNFNITQKTKARPEYFTFIAVASKKQIQLPRGERFAEFSFLGENTVISSPMTVIREK